MIGQKTFSSTNTHFSPKSGVFDILHRCTAVALQSKNVLTWTVNATRTILKIILVDLETLRDTIVIIVAIEVTFDKRIFGHFLTLNEILFRSHVLFLFGIITSFLSFLTFHFWKKVETGNFSDLVSFYFIRIWYYDTYPSGIFDRFVRMALSLAFPTVNTVQAWATV